MHVRDERQVEFSVVGDSVVALAEEPQEALPLLERVVVLPHQETHEAELQLGQDLVRPARLNGTPVSQGLGPWSHPLVSCFMKRN